MNIKAFYSSIGSDYEEVLKRFGNGEIILEFVKSFAEDDSFSLLETAYNNGDVKTAFRAAHTLKGISLNLGFDNLYSASSELTEFLRTCKDFDGSQNLFDTVKENYNVIIDKISRL